MLLSCEKTAWKASVIIVDEVNWWLNCLFTYISLDSRPHLIHVHVAQFRFAFSAKSVATSSILWSLASSSSHSLTGNPALHMPLSSLLCSHSYAPCYQLVVLWNRLECLCISWPHPLTFTCSSEIASTNLNLHPPEFLFDFFLFHRSQQLCTRNLKITLSHVLCSHAPSWEELTCAFHARWEWVLTCVRLLTRRSHTRTCYLTCDLYCEPSVIPACWFVYVCVHCRYWLWPIVCYR